MPSHSPILLFVDDDADDQFLIQDIIQELAPAIKIVTAFNGLEALHFLSHTTADEELPELIIMDINMPLMDGKDAAIRIRNEARLSAIPLVLFTTSSSLLDKAFCEQHGIAFMTKPAGGKEMQQVMAQLLSILSTNIVDNIR